MKIINNFLPIEQFKKIQNLILNLDFPWRMRERMTNEDKNIYFSYSFFNENMVNSTLYGEYIIPLLKQLKCNAPIQIRANMFINKLFDKSGWHIDHENYEEKKEHTTAILYLNNCNGGTEFKIKNKITFVKAEENKIVIFPSKTLHRAVTSTDVDIRYIINFNYFE